MVGGQSQKGVVGTVHRLVAAVEMKAVEKLQKE